MKKHYLIFSIVVAAILVFAGCSGGGSDSISTSMPSGDENPQIANSDFENWDAPNLFGAYSLDISQDLKTVELNPIRMPSIGESYLVNGMLYFTATPCSTCLKIDGIGLESGKIKLVFSLTHPFEPGNTSLPPSATNRLDLNIFDVAMIIVPIEMIPSVYASGAIYTNACVNQAGYTRELANLIKEPAACPYFLVVDDSVTGISTYNKFAMGTHGKKFDVWFSDVGTYTLYLTLAYGSSAKKAQRLTPKYYNPEFNRKAAWRVDVTPPEGSSPPALGNTWDDADHTTPYFVTVEVFDWQIGATVNPSLLNTTDIYAASNVASVEVEIPGMTSTPISVTSPTSGTGKPIDPQIFSVPVANANGLPPGEYTGLVKVLDTRAPSNPITSRDYLIDYILPTAFAKVTPSGLNFRAEDVCAVGSYAFTITASQPLGFHVVDISAPESAVEIGSLPLSNLTCVDAITDYACVCDNSSMTIIDVSEPDMPFILNQVTGLDVPRDLAIKGGYAYVATAGGLVIIDVDPPGAASIIKGVSTFGNPKRMAVTNGYAYMTTTMGSSSFLEIIEVDPPSTAYNVSQTELILPAGALFGITVSGYYAYITGQRTLLGYQNQMLVVDIDPPETPLTEKILGMPELGLSIEIQGDYVYYGGYSHIYVVDMTPLQYAHVITSVAIEDYANNIDIEGSYVYVANVGKGLQIFTLYVPSGGGLVNYVIPEYATYQTFKATVVDG